MHHYSLPINKLTTIGILLFSMLLGGCLKEDSPVKEGNNRLEIAAEGLGGHQKMYIDDVNAYWLNGDKVNINGTEYTITVNSNNPSTAYIENVPVTETYYGVFPASIFRSRDGGNVTVELPDTYQYKTDGSHQVLDAPLGYYGDGDGRLYFRHLTGALTIQITAPEGFSVDHVVVGTTQGYRMSGSFTYDLASIDGITQTGTSGSNTVEMLFDHDQLVFMETGTQNVQIPIPAVGGIVNFSITVEGHLQGTKHTFSRTQNSGGILNRGILGYVPVNINSGQADVTLSSLFPVDGNGYPQIATPTDFRIMVQAINNKWTDPQGGAWSSTAYFKKHYVITAPLDMSGITVQPIGEGITFYGSIDGGSHWISNLTVSSNYNTDKGAWVGLISIFNNNDCTLQNIYLRNLTLIYTGNNPDGKPCYMGGICAEHDANKNYNYSNCKVDNITVQSGAATIVDFGGIVGYVYPGKAINFEDCSYSQSNTLTLSGLTTIRFGGIFGERSSVLNSSDTIRNCSVNVNANLSATNVYAGGQIGYWTSEKPKIHSEYNTILGHIEASPSVYIGPHYGYGTNINNQWSCLNDNISGFTSNRSGSATTQEQL